MRISPLCSLITECFAEGDKRDVCVWELMFVCVYMCACVCVCVPALHGVCCVCVCVCACV